jgi:hypothetical protein
LEGVLRELAHQQSALSQQQTALLQLQAESLLLQRLLIERAMGGAPVDEVATVVATGNPDATAAEPVVESLPAEVASVPVENAEASVADTAPSEELLRADDSPFGEPPNADKPSSRPSSDAGSLPAFAIRSRAARYMQTPAAAATRQVSRQEVELLARLYETGDAAHLVLNFGQYRGASLVRVAQTDPDYLHQLALTAQRPEVRAAARQMVITLEEIAAHQARPGRPASRRARSSG